MKFIFTAILALCSIQYSIAQGYLIKGSVGDTLNSAKLQRSSVTIIRASDSIIESFTRTNASGNFEVRVRKEGKYILRITFPSFADYVDVINVNKDVTDIGEVSMVSKEHLLKEFVITRQIAAIKIKGDTTEYVADSFKVKEGANVEDLLKKLPGIQVDKNGQITAQGETVQKILVDGEEFFADDPKVVTKGLQADAVDKVQVYNKKSDQAEFTGIEDGEKTKTINLMLKENKKKGYFGKLEAGGGNDGYFQNQGMVNAFKGKRQLSVFGITSNTNKAGLGWEDNDKFGSSNRTTEIGDDGEIYNTWTSTDQDFSGWDGRYNGQGLPKTWTGGAHVADKWNEDKNHISGNYRYAKQNVEINGATNTINALPGDSSNVTWQNKEQFSTADRHAADVMYERKIDSSSSIKVTANAGQKTTKTYTHYNMIGALQNAEVTDTQYYNDRTITGDAVSTYINASLLYRKKFAKKGRTMSLDIKENYKDNQSEGILNSVINYADTTASQTTNQRKINDGTSLAFSAKGTYTEPLSKKTFLIVDYSSSINNNSSLNYSYNSIPGQLYSDVPNDTFSSNYRYNIFTNAGGAAFRYVYKKLNYSFGGTVSNARYTQTDLRHGDTSNTINYLNFFPKASFKYKLSNQRSIDLSYNGNTRQPSITQVQPLVQNNDPTRVAKGNPGLRQEFTHSMRASYNDYKVLTGRYIWSSVSFTSVNDAISTSQDIVNGVYTTQYINVNGNYNGWAYLNYGFKLAKTGIRIGGHVNPSIARVNNIINGQKNTNDNNTYSGGLEFNYEKEEQWEFSFSPGIAYNDNKATISAYSTSYWSSSSDASVSVKLPSKFRINTDVDMMFRQKTKVLNGNNNVIKWNASVSRTFLKNDQLILELSVYDILNQNLGFNRSAQGSTVTQETYNTIRRYGLLNLAWNFSHKPGETK